MLEKNLIIELKSIISQLNPWRDKTNKDWALNDGALREIKKAESEGLFSPPKFLYYLRENFFNKAFENPEESGILIIRGPRRIGKTSTLKYIIETMISQGYSPESFLYLSLDLDELFFEVHKKRKLREMLTEIIKLYKKPDIPLILILDEVTFYKAWARVLKNLVDEGTIGDGIAIIATGSYSLDLSSAKRELSGRFGKLGERCGEDLIFPPRRFIEVAESVLNNAAEFRSFFAKNLGAFPKRTGAIEYLAGFQNEEDNSRFGYQKILNQMIEKYYDDLHLLLFDNYFFAGGYPRKIYQTIISTAAGKITVPDERYLSDIYNLLISDAKKFDLDEEIIRKILSKIDFPSMRIGGDLKLFCDLGASCFLNKEECEKYVGYLTSSGLFSLIPVISNKNQIDYKSNFINTSNLKFKLLVRDPAVFFSIYFGSRGIKNIFERSKTLLLENHTVVEFLFESIIISHLFHHPVIQKQGGKNVSFILNSEEQGKEGEELLDGLAWYLNFQDKFVTVPLEVKFTNGDLDLSKIKLKAEKLKQEFGIKRLIVVTNKKIFEVNEDYVLIPAEIFLLLT